MKRILRLCAAAAVVLVAAGCSTGRENNALLLGGIAAGLGVTPSNDLDQIYYIGVFDPTEQVPEMIYRVRVRGQASALSWMRFASGWVHADMIDSLNSKAVGVPQNLPGVPDCTADPAKCGALPTGRRLVMFGPDGFREAPANHRLVIVMGSDADAFFSQMDKALGEYSSITAERDNLPLQRDFMAALLALKDDQQKVRDLKLNLVKEGVQ
jgi:hypothetical protein